MHQKLWLDDVKFLRYGGRQADGQKKWHREVGVPPKNFIILTYQVMIYYKNSVTWTSLDIGPKAFSERGRKTILLEFDSLYPILNEEQGGNWAFHTYTHCGHSCCNENFQILLTSDLHQLADNANENHNYIACLFIL